MTQLPKTVDYSVMSMKQKCLQQLPKTEHWDWVDLGDLIAPRPEVEPTTPLIKSPTHYLLRHQDTQLTGTVESLPWSVVMTAQSQMNSIFSTSKQTVQWTCIYRKHDDSRKTWHQQNHIGHISSPPQDTPVQEVFSWLLAGHQLTVSGGPSTSSAILRPPKNLLIDWFLIV